MLRSFVKESEEMWIRLILLSDICYVYYIWPCFTKKDIGISWNILTLPTDCKYYLLNEMNLISLCFTAFFFQWYTASALHFLVLGILFSTSLNVGLEAPSVGWIFSWSSLYFFERQVYQNLKRSTTISFLWHEKFLALEKLYV